MQNKIQSLFKILQVVDSDVCFLHYRLNIEIDSEGVITPISDILVVKDPGNISESITGMSKFFFRAHPNSKGENICTANVHLLHTQPIENIIADTKEDFKEVDANIGLPPIQHWEVGSILFLQCMHPDVDVDNLHLYLSAALKN